MKWRQIGAAGELAMDPLPAILEADIVVAQGRSAIEAMACGRAVWVFGPSGGDGWITEVSYPQIEADGFRGRATATLSEAGAFGRALAEYRPRMGEANRDLAVLHHSPYDHAVEILGLLSRGITAAAPDAPLREMARLVRTHHDAQSRVAAVALELRATHERCQMLEHENAINLAELTAARHQVAQLPSAFQSEPKARQGALRRALDQLARIRRKPGGK